jgi:hypothetical protein
MAVLSGSELQEKGFITVFVVIAHFLGSCEHVVRGVTVGQPPGWALTGYTIGYRLRFVVHELASEGEIMVTSNGKPVPNLSAVSPEDLEQSLAARRQARAAAAVEAMQRQSVAAGLHHLKPSRVQREIAAIRKGRRQ